MINAITVDLEDWRQSTFDKSLSISSLVVENTKYLLSLFDECECKGTFFVQGMVAEKYPSLIREISDHGHEVQSHGYSHQPLYEMNRDQVCGDLKKSKALIEDATGLLMTGYRAPDFSILEGNIWALDVISEIGFEYDSSIYPIRLNRYGIKNFRRKIHVIKNIDLIEIPVSTLNLSGTLIPFGGGGYFRLLPYSLIRQGIKMLNSEGLPSVIYMHPYEFSNKEWGMLKNQGLKVPLSQKVHQGLGRGRMSDKFRKMTSEFRFEPIKTVLEKSGVSNK